MCCTRIIIIMSVFKWETPAVVYWHELFYLYSLLFLIPSSPPSITVQLPTQICSSFCFRADESMSQSEVSGVSVPSRLAPFFSSQPTPGQRQALPFSYSRPNPYGPKTHNRICIPKVRRFFPDKASVMILLPSSINLHSKRLFFIIESIFRNA